MKIWERFTCRAPQGARRYGQRSHGVLLMIFQPTRWMTSFASTFQPTRPLRGATKNLVRANADIVISTHAPLAGRDRCLQFLHNPQGIISTHAPLAGRDSCLRRNGASIILFQPTRPLRGATCPLMPVISPVLIFQPTRPLRGATGERVAVHTPAQISTHAPLAGRDRVLMGNSISSWYFNPRAPCGARRGVDGRTRPAGGFQPTRPLRGATPESRKDVQQI